MKAKYSWKKSVLNNAMVKQAIGRAKVFQILSFVCKNLGLGAKLEYAGIIFACHS